jgi:DNA-cytosine methyltransferase
MIIIRKNNSMKNKKIKVLSLFDGISIAQQAFKELNIPVEKYYASEIDKYAISITQHNFPNTIQRGSIVNLTYAGNYPKFDLIIGGSPCQDLSIAKKNREGLKGSRSGLFYEFVRLIKEVKPKYFVLENVASMPKEAKIIITRELFNLPEKEWECIDDSINKD